MKKALVVGGVSYNIMIHVADFPAPQPQTLYARSFHETIGSTGAGKALNLRRLGFDVTLHAPIGDDAYGTLIRENLAQAGITFVADLDPAGTQRHVNLMDANGQRISIFLVAGTFDLVFDQPRLEALIPANDYILLNINNYCRSVIPAIKRHGKAIWCDLHDYDGANPYYADFVGAADYLFLSSNALPDYRPWMQQMIAQGKQLVVCTHGERGSTTLSAAGEWLETPIIARYPLRDSNGAGDAFMAGVVYGHACGYALAKCLRFGTIASGLGVGDAELAAAGLSCAVVEAEYQAEYGD